MPSTPSLLVAGPPQILLRCKHQQALTPGTLSSFLVARRPLLLKTRILRQFRRSRDSPLRSRASSAASPATLANSAPLSASEGRSGNPLTSLSRTWHSYWSLGRAQKQQQDKSPKKLGQIVSKLWNIMNVNGYLLTAALFFLVSPAAWFTSLNTFSVLHSNYICSKPCHHG